MSKTPFLDFVTKLSKDPKLSRRYYERVLEVFDGTGLSHTQIQALCSGNRKEIAEHLQREWIEAGGEGDMGAPPLNKMPLNITNNTL